MVNSSKTILVIVPVYNKSLFLKKCLDSILNQTYKNFKIVLVDDASTDNSLSICEQYSHHENVTIFSNEKNMGCYYSRNKALYEFRDEDWDFFTIHDSDDYSNESRFSEILKPFSDPTLLGLKTTYIREDVNGVPQKDRVNPNKVDIYSSEGIAIFRRECFEILGYYDNTRFSGDTDYWWRLESLCNTSPQYRHGKHLPQLYHAVTHGENLTKIYSFEVDRPKYFNKSIAEIKKMAESGSFYRPFIVNKS